MTEETGREILGRVERIEQHLRLLLKEAGSQVLETLAERVELERPEFGGRRRKKEKR